MPTFAADMNPIISAQGLSIGYRTAHRTCVVHQGLTLALEGGGLTCLLGANGSGKSTLLRTLAALQPPLGGELLLQGRPLVAYTAKELARRIGIVLTERTQIVGLTVAELIALGRQPHTGFFGRLREHDRQLVRMAMDQVGIAHKAASSVAELSDGERQKAMIAKALVQECPVILLDEPTAFLDAPSRIDVMRLLRRLANQQGKAILLSTHDTHLAIALADRLWLLAPDGLHMGTAHDMVAGGELDALFPGAALPFPSFAAMARTLD